MRAFLIALPITLLALLIAFPPTAAGEGPKVGALAPDVTFSLDDGTKLKLREVDRPAVVYFYPKDDTPGCTKEACTFRDRTGDLEKTGALVIGVSFDDAASHKAFREKYKLPFALATDDGSIAEAFGVAVRGFAPLRFHARDTFVIGKDHKIAAVLRGVNPVEGVDQVLAALKDASQIRSSAATDVPLSALRWTWNDEAPSLDACVARELAGLEVSFDPPRDKWEGLAAGGMAVVDDLPALRVRKGDRPPVSLHVHAATLLARSGDVVVMAEYGQMTTGCALEGHDLETGKRLWRTELKGLGDISHSKYRNRVNLEVIDGVVVVRGHESAGRYIECVALRTGKQLHHEVLGDR